MLTLYHGSTVNIDRIDLAKSRPNKDFGLGFYLSADRQQAWRMGEFKALTEEQGYTLEEAIDRVYTSPIYEKLSHPDTGLFFQSPRYVLSYL